MSSPGDWWYDYLSDNSSCANCPSGFPSPLSCPCIEVLEDRWSWNNYIHHWCFGNLDLAQWYPKMRGGKWSNKKCILCILRIYTFLLTVSWHCPVSNKKTINNIKVMIFKLCCSTKERGLLLLLDDDDAISIFILLRMRCQVKKRRRRCICVLYIHAWKKSKSSVEKMREINDE